MTLKIRVLSDDTINQIAAGEVVENPASVVKELVENAIDAGASKITIEIKGGGHLLIRIVDNGSGMGLEDAKMSLQRHATSKIREVDDLSRLTSMGFRGEALASIASISKLRLETSLDGEEAFEVVCHGGSSITTGTTSRTKGTTFEIASLFYNTPARRKFQKSASRSSAEIMKCVTKLALANRGVAFELISQDISILKTSNDPSRTIEEVLGSEFSKDVKEVLFKESDHEIKGVIGSSFKTRSNRSGQYLFVNQRPIYSPLVSDAVKFAFGTRISSKDFPLFVLWMTIPTDLIDVNVHPQKHTIRFQNEEMVRHFVIQAVQKALSGEEAITMPTFLPKPKLQGAVLREKMPTYSMKESMPRTSPPKERSFFVSHEIKPEFEVLGFVDSYAIVDQVAGDVVFGENTLFLDLYQMQARIAFDAVVKRLKTQTNPPIQTLLFAESIEVSPAEAAIILQHVDVLKAVGFDIRPAKNGVFTIEGVAPIYSAVNVKEMVQKILHEMRVEIDFDKIARLVASSLPTKKTYAKAEVKALLQELLKSSDCAVSPSGKRIFLPLNKSLLDQVFSKGESFYAKN